MYYLSTFLFNLNIVPILDQVMTLYFNHALFFYFYKKIKLF